MHLSISNINIKIWFIIFIAVKPKDSLIDLSDEAVGGTDASLVSQMSRMGTATGQLMSINSVTAQSGADEFDMLAQSRNDPVRAVGYVRRSEIHNFFS